MSRPPASTGKLDAVTKEADKLMAGLLTKANEEEASVDFGLAVMQAATRYLAVKNRLPVPDEENAFDEWRRAAAPGAGDAGGGLSSASGQLPSRTRQNGARRRGTITERKYPPHPPSSSTSAAK